MVEKLYKKLDIAVEYLDMAMRLYMERENLFCAIHLAAAAEEILGKHLPEDARIHTLAVKAEINMQKIETGNILSSKDAHNKLSREKNSIKHMNGPDDSDVLIDLTSTAVWSINQALINFYKLNLPKSPTLWKYEDASNEEIQRLREKQTL